MCSLLALSVLQIPVSAEMVNVNIQIVSGHPYRGIGTALNSNGTMIERYDSNAEILTVGNTKVFCIEPWATLTNGLSVSEDNLTSALSGDANLEKDLSLIAYYGYWTTSQTVEDYQTTQIMIWERRGWTFSQVPSYYASKKAAIQAKIANHAKIPSFSGQTLTINVGETIDLTDTNGVLSMYMKSHGYKMGTSYTEKGFNFYWWNDTLHMRANADADENSTFGFMNVPSADQGTNIVYVNPGKQSTSPLQKISDPSRFSINFNVQKYGKIQIVKKDAQSQKIVEKAGIKYDIYKTDGTKVSTIESNEQGIAQSGLLLFGDYYYVETLAPEDYQINSSQHPFTVNTSTNIQEFVDKEIVDERVTGRSTLTKVIDGDKVGNAKIDGAVYGFYARENILDPADGSVVYEKDEEIGQYTIVNGTTTAEVDYLGKYYWKEIKPSEGCKVAGNLDVDLLYDNQNVPVIVKDMISYEPLKKQAFQIQKLEDPSHGESLPLGGAEFTVKLQSDIEQMGWDNAPIYDKLITDDQGSATSIELPYGIYLVKETKTPTENHSPVKDFEVIISEDNRKPQTYRYFIDDVLKTKLAVYKRDAETENIVPLSGMKFKIKALTTNADFDAGEYVSYWQWFPYPHQVDTWETTDNGYVFLEISLRSGTYQIEEVESPDGYLLNHEPLQFTITKGWHQQTGPDDESLVTTVVMKDAPVKGQVKIDKQAELFKGYESTPTEYGDLYTPKYETGLLPNVKFEIKAKTNIIGADGKVWYRAGQQVTTMTTDGINITASPLLPIGTDGNNLYTLQEIETEDGYVLDDTIYTFRFDYVDQETPVVNPTYLDENGNEMEIEDTFTLENDKQKALVMSSKTMETSIFEDNANAMQNVVFGFYSENVQGLNKDSLVGVSEVTPLGTFNTTITQPGSYYAKELKTSDNYELDQTEYPFTFDYNGDRLTVLNVNDGKPIQNVLKRGSLEIIKTDEETKLPLVNVWFDLSTDKDFNNIIKTSSTDENGRILFEELEINHTYYVREKYGHDYDMVTNGYIYDPTIHVVEIDSTDKVTINLTNKKVYGKVQFTKTGESFKDVEIIDGEYGKEHHPIWSQGILLGAEMTVIADEDIVTWDGTLHYQKGDVVIVLSSDWQTTDSLLLPVGSYKAYESKAPDGYVKDDTVYEFTIHPNGKEEIQLNPITINNDRKKLNIDFTKELEEQKININEQAYENVVFGIYAKDDIMNYVNEPVIEKGSLISTHHIDETGQLLNVLDLPKGNYFLKEIKTDEQYVLDPNEYDFTIAFDENNDSVQNITINEGKPVINKLMKGKIEINKYTKDKVYLSYRERSSLLSTDMDASEFNRLSEDDKNFLGGVTFELATDKDFKNIIRTGKTNASGYLVFDELERGTYYVREKQALDFYEINETVFEVTIEINEQIETIDVDNNLIKSYVDIKKVDKDNENKMLSNAAFTMYSDPECTQPIKEVTTNKDGIAHFDNIKFGSAVYIKETKAPAGYKLSDEIVKVIINEEWVNSSKDTRVITYKNEKEPSVPTGDNTSPLPYALASMLSVFVLVMMKQKKKRIN